MNKLKHKFRILIFDMLPKNKINGDISIIQKDNSFC